MSSSINAPNISIQVPSTNIPGARPDVGAQKSQITQGERSASTQEAKENLQDISSREQMQAALEELVQKLSTTENSLRFSVDDLNSDLVIHVVNKHSDEVVREIRLSNVVDVGQDSRALRGIFVLHEV